MNKLAISIVVAWCGVAALAPVAVAPLHADQPWRRVVVPTVAEAAASFAQPPAE